MKQTQILITGIEYKVKKLAEQKSLLLEENKKLKDEIERLHIEINKKDTDINDLKEKIKTLGLSKSLVSKQDKKEIHQRIDDLVREIDKSISVINSLNK
ncbi:MAG TPA: hypothetical protein VJ939_01690 [Bacteroidales bacterium]|nr:hypothetical protein [Bacteroidales bacterium]